MSKSEVSAPASITLSCVAETSYASCGDLSLAYQVFGDGPIELVFVGPMVSHVELFWTLPEFKAFFEQLATFCRVLLFDKAGLGLSDPIPKVRTLDDRAAEIEAVMDAVGFDKAVIFGMSEGGPTSIVFAAKRPERTRALIVTGSYPFMATEWDDIDRDPARCRRASSPSSARMLPHWVRATCSLSARSPICRKWPSARSAWGSGATAKAMFPSIDRCAAGNVRAHVREPGHGAGNNRVGLPDRRAGDPADDRGADLGHPWPRRAHAGAVWPVSGQTHPRRAVPRGRRRGSRTLVQRSRHDLDRDRGVPHR